MVSRVGDGMSPTPLKPLEPGDIGPAQIQAPPPDLGEPRDPTALDELWARACPDPIGPWDDLWRLHEAGVPTRCLHPVGALDIAIKQGRWVEWFRGDRAFVIPVCANDLYPGITYEVDEIVDLVAFRLETPRAFWRFEDHVAAPFLGSSNLERAQLFEEPIMVHETPLDWLRAGRRGIVILEWKDFWPFTLAGIPALQCMDEGFGRRLKARLERPFQIPEIRVAV